jgi:hypothetical protein
VVSTEATAVCSVTSIWNSGSGPIIRCGLSARSRTHAIRRFCGAVLALWAGVDSAGAACSGVAAAGVLLDPVGASAGRADRIRPAVPLVCWPGHRRGCLGRDDVHQEPRPAARWRCRDEVPVGGAVAEPGEAAVVERALLGGRHADRSLGPARRASSRGTVRAIRRTRAERRAGFSRRASDERHPRLDHGPGCTALPEGSRQGS